MTRDIDFIYLNKFFPQNILDDFKRIWNTPIPGESNNLLIESVAFPKLNAFEQNEKMVLQFTAPFVTKKDVSIETDTKLRKITVKFDAHQDDDDVQYFIREISRTAVKRTIVVSDKYDKTLIMMGAQLGIAISMILLAVGQFGSAALLFVLILYGMSRYVQVPAQHALSSVTAAEHPQGIGFSYTGIALGQIFSAPLIGYLMDTFGIRNAFLVSSVFPFISIVILLVFRKIRDK